jgi:flagella basal body P-ring formation protein FlgA
MIGGGADGVWYVDVDGAEGRAARLRLRAGTEAVVPVAAHDLERGVTLTAHDIALQPTVAWGPPGRGEDEVAPGWVTRRRIARGEPLVTPGVALPDAVKPGDDVRIVYVSGPVELVVMGRAAGSGAIGERVAVRAETGRRLEGVIVAPGTVKVDSGGARR